ncbi:MAG: VCBS repeat-containing protein [Acidobacteriota bacterium]|nr:VCBS repeat-containing protein [Acidobacteriota bacterium]
MKKILWSVCLLVFARAGCFSFEYMMGAYMSSYSAPANQVTALSGGNWNDGHFDLALQTDFYFYGRKVTHIRIMTDGYIVFGFGGSPGETDISANVSIPKPGAPNAYAAPWWDDWDLTNKGGIYYMTNYTVTVVEWRNVPHHDDPTSGYTFKVMLYSCYYPYCPNTIIFSYDDADSGDGTHDFGKTGTIGIERYAGSQGEEFSYNTQSIAMNFSSLFLAPFVPAYDTTDFWGTGKPDATVFRPSQGAWYKRKNDGSASSVTFWGTRGDAALPGDYDGDGAAEECVVRCDGWSYYWFSHDPAFVIQWGKLYDLPIPADYNGDGVTDIAVWRPEDGSWSIYFRGSGTADVVLWGTAGDIPLPADYDGDGMADCAVYRPENKTWYIRRTTNPSSPWVVTWGADGDIPLPIKISGTDYSNICVYRPLSGLWFSYDQKGGAKSVLSWGADIDQPVPNDWDGSGMSNPAVFRPNEGKWFFYSATPVVISWGTLGDKPRCRRSRSIIAPASR